MKSPIKLCRSKLITKMMNRLRCKVLQQLAGMALEMITTQEMLLMETQAQNLLFMAEPLMDIGWQILILEEKVLPEQKSPVELIPAKMKLQMPRFTLEETSAELCQQLLNLLKSIKLNVMLLEIISKS